MAIIVLLLQVVALEQGAGLPIARRGVVEGSAASAGASVSDFGLALGFGHPRIHLIMCAMA
jgi:hypothetical protein